MEHEVTHTVARNAAESSVQERIQSFVSSIDVNEFSEKVGGSSAGLVRNGIWFAGGFVFGFLFKKYFKFFIITAVLSVFAIKWLEYNHVLQIDWDGLHELFGVSAGVDFNQYLQIAFDWIKDNIITFLITFAGFLLGYRLG